jgi:hypothetical protein
MVNLVTFLHSSLCRTLNSDWQQQTKRQKRIRIQGRKKSRMRAKSVWEYIYYFFGTHTHTHTSIHPGKSIFVCVPFRSLYTLLLNATGLDVPILWPIDNSWPSRQRLRVTFCVSYRTRRRVIPPWGWHYRHHQHHRWYHLLRWKNYYFPYCVVENSDVVSLLVLPFSFFLVHTKTQYICWEIGRSICQSFIVSTLLWHYNANSLFRRSSSSRCCCVSLSTKGCFQQCTKKEYDSRQRNLKNNADWMMIQIQ